MMPVQEAPETLDSYVEVFRAEAIEENTIISADYVMEE